MPTKLLAPLVTILGIAACGGPKQTEAVTAPTGTGVSVGSASVRPAALPIRSTDPALVRTLATLATGSAPTPEQVLQTQRALDTHQITLDHYIDTLLTSDAFATDVAPLMILRANLSRTVGSAGVSGYVLQKTKDADPIYYLDKQCKSNQVVRVHPWWDLDHEVRVCADSYRPDQWMTKTHAGDLPMACRALGASGINIDGGGERCGCGPNLLRCYDSGARRVEHKWSLVKEVRNTVAHIVRADRPIEEVFTSNETWRDRLAQFVYLERQLESRQEKNPAQALRELEKWPEAGQWAARDELLTGAHAGVLTAPQLMYEMPDLRQRMTLYYDVLFCMQPDSAGATPEQAIKIKNANLQLQSGGWQELAAKPVCTNCHARLDYGLQYFTGWPNGFSRAFYYPPSQQKGKGPFYVDNLEDRRGEAPLTPSGFAGLAVAQPNFRRCMAQDVGGYVFGSSLNKSTLDKLTETASVSGGVKMHRLMSAALKLFAEQWTPTAAPATVPSPASASTDATITLTKEQHAALESLCTDCHDNSGELENFTTATLPRATVVSMLTNVTFGRMPKNDPLDDRDRRQFLETFIPSLWSGAEAAQARAYMVERMAALPAFRPEVMFDLIEQRVGKRGGPWRTLEQDGRGADAQVTPGLVTIFGVATVEACRAAHSTRAEVDRCLEAAVLPDTLAIKPR